MASSMSEKDSEPFLRRVMPLPSLSNFVSSDAAGTSNRVAFLLTKPSGR